MKIELKNVKHSEFASHETDCFTATVYIDGKREGTVSNQGMGGPNDYEPPALYEKLKAHADTLPPNTAYGVTIQPNADCVIGDLLIAWLRLREHKKLCRNKVWYRIPGHKYHKGEYHFLNAEFCPSTKMFLIGKHGPDTWFLNEHMGEEHAAA